MASSGKRKTTMAKLQRESRLRDKRAVKEARKAARKQDAGDGDGDGADSIQHSDDTYHGRLAEDPYSA
jgi:hypothetical protein